MNTCTNCQTQVPEGKKFCFNCASPIPQKQEPKFTMPPMPELSEEEYLLPEQVQQTVEQSQVAPPPVQMQTPIQTQEMRQQNQNTQQQETTDFLSTPIERTAGAMSYSGGWLASLITGAWKSSEFLKFHTNQAIMCNLVLVVWASLTALIIGSIGLRVFTTLAWLAMLLNAITIIISVGCIVLLIAAMLGKTIAVPGISKIKILK